METLPLQLNIGNAAPRTARINPKVYLEWTISKKNLVIGEQTMSMLKIFRRVDIARAELKMLDRHTFDLIYI